MKKLYQHNAMKQIIDPIARDILKKELLPERMLRKTNKAGNEIYVVTHHNAPYTMQEIGRLREMAFRDGGGGTGESVDIDEHDTMSNPYYQLLVWNPETEEIIGGYRFKFGDEVDFDKDGQPIIATAHLFRFSPLFQKEYLPHTLELGRSFVALEYQSSKAGAKALFALDNLWDGLGAIVTLRPQMKYYFGKVTMYSSYNREARDLVLGLCYRLFADPQKLVEPIHPLTIRYSKETLKEIFPTDNFKENYKILNQAVRNFGVNVPPLISSYLSLSDSLIFFGTALNEEFGEVEESGILIKVDDIIDSKRERHIETFIPLKDFRLSVR